jgi:hypothetical protein
MDSLHRLTIAYTNEIFELFQAEEILFLTGIAQNNRMNSIFNNKLVEEEKTIKKPEV